MLDITSGVGGSVTAGNGAGGKAGLLKGVTLKNEGGIALQSFITTGRGGAGSGSGNGGQGGALSHVQGDGLFHSLGETSVKRNNKSSSEDCRVA